MDTSVLEEPSSGGENPLSEESEREILGMVEEQLDRPNPPDTKVLYRRAMHFIDRDVRHLSLQQFNAKFPLQVKRRRARERPEGNASSSARSGNAGSTAERGVGRTNGRGTDDGRSEEGAESREPPGRTHRSNRGESTMAADRNPDVMEMIEEELREDPDVSNRDLKLKAEEIDESIESLSARQFHARYPLQVKRKLSATRSKSEARGDVRPVNASDERREVVREALLDFAKAVAGADDRGEVIDALTEVDEYVDRVVGGM